MENFEFVSPTHFVFGKGAEEQVGTKLAERGARKALLHFGGQSAVKSGLIDCVKASLDAQGIEHVELGGVRPNPEITLVREGVALGKDHAIHWVLAGGGGSVASGPSGGGSVSTACLAKIVMPRARSGLSVSRKASLWSTRPSLRSTPAR